MACMSSRLRCELYYKCEALCPHQTCARYSIAGIPKVCFIEGITSQIFEQSSGQDLKNNQILILVMGVSTAGMVVTTPCVCSVILTTIQSIVYIAMAIDFH